MRTTISKATDMEKPKSSFTEAGFGNTVDTMPESPFAANSDWNSLSKNTDLNAALNKEI